MKILSNPELFFTTVAKELDRYVNKARKNGKEISTYNCDNYYISYYMLPFEVYFVEKYKITENNEDIITMIHFVKNNHSVCYNRFIHLINTLFPKYKFSIKAKNYIKNTWSVFAHTSYRLLYVQDEMVNRHIWLAAQFKKRNEK